MKPIQLILFFIALTLFPNLLSSQSIGRLELSEPTSTWGVLGWSITQSADNGYYISGRSGQLKTQSLIKLDANLNRIWNRKFTNIEATFETELSLAPDGGLYWVGDADPTNNMDMSVIRFDTEGKTVWQRSITSSTASNDDRARCVLTAGDTSVFIAGDIGLSNRPYITHILADGSQDWSKEINASNSYISGLRYSIDSSALYVVSRINNDLGVLKIDPTDGSLIWNNNLQFSPYTHGEALVITEDDDVIVFGVGRDSSFNDIIISARVDGNTGDLMWSKAYSDPPFDLDINVASMAQDGSIYLGCRHIDTAPPFGYGFNYMVMKVDTSGTIDWSRRYGSDTTVNMLFDLRTEENGFICIGQNERNWLIIKGDSMGNSGCTDSIVTITSADVTLTESSFIPYGAGGSYTYFTPGIIEDTLADVTDSVRCGLEAPCTIIAAFTASDTLICIEDSIVFTNVSSLGPFEWWVEDSLISTATDFTINGTLADTLEIRLVAGTGGCTDTTQLEVQIHEKPDPIFTSIDLGSSIDFSSTGTGSTSWFWSFGNGDSSSLPNPNYSYDTSGTYEVCLTVQNSANCAEVSCDSITTIVTDLDETIPSPSFRIYPNPGDGNFSIDGLADNLNHIEVKVFDLAGKEVENKTIAKSGSEFKLNLSRIQGGVYFIMIQMGETREYKKVVVR